ncbi:hypothetical protein BCR43DRAFT_493638 [Syncephalastrum racemosum]|uniref:Uncharacterized protein n=1 Tax=Syncephalastrum racemosum TaxID=13706 RepID=A0A1X2HAW3_SYNRA|nr:hypothetical protein BCR43DRAFT_493638 [Syncephalastrum racemosum]
MTALLMKTCVRISSSSLTIVVLILSKFFSDGKKSCRSMSPKTGSRSCIPLNPEHTITTHVVTAYTPITCLYNAPSVEKRAISSRIPTSWSHAHR